MTAILGYADGERVWIGGDSRALNGWDAETLTTRKVFRVGDVLIGGSGVFQHVELLRLRLTAPPADGVDDEHYIGVRLMDAIADTWKAAGVTVGEEIDGATTGLLIGYHGVIYGVDPKLCVRRSIEQLYSLGSGGDLALGAFAAMLEFSWLGQEVRPSEMMVEALKIAGRLNLTVAPPFYVLTL